MAASNGKIYPEKLVWRQTDGTIIACTEKNKVMQENLQEFTQTAQDLLEDAILMGCNEGQVREVLEQIIRGLENPYQP